MYEKEKEIGTESIGRNQPLGKDSGQGGNIGNTSLPKNRQCSTHNTIRFIDLFGGVGGFRLGLEKANDDMELGGCGQKEENIKTNISDIVIKPNKRQSTFSCVAYYEWDKYAVQIYNKRFGENHKPEDVTKVRSEDIPEHDLLCAGFPCQSFSIAGKRRGFQDTRGTLFFEIARILRDKKPKMVLLENVKGLLSHDSGKTFGIILNTLWELGYVGQYEVLNSKNFGVPQNRERVFIFGFRGECPPKVFPIGQSNEINTNQKQEFSEQVSNTIRTNYSSGFSNETYVEGELKYEGAIMSEKNKKRLEDREEMFTLTGQDIHGVMETKPVQMVNKNRAKKPYNPDNREMKLKIRDNDTSYTVKSTAHEFMVKQQSQIRRLTPTECERLQGFPDGWTEGVSDTQRYKMMGNAVTVNVVQAIGKSILEEFVKS